MLHRVSQRGRAGGAGRRQVHPPAPGREAVPVGQVRPDEAPQFPVHGGL